MWVLLHPSTAQVPPTAIEMHHGKNIYDGKPSELASDKTVVDVYLGEGASELIADALGDAGDE